jgi:hypothetical protein
MMGASYGSVLFLFFVIRHMHVFMYLRVNKFLLLLEL